jgi:hypothetical protein
MTDLNFDIVICVGPNDSCIVEQNLQFTKKNIIGYRNIYLLCADPNINIEGTITIDEKIFPFSKNDLIDITGNNDRIGWYLQQLLKIYSGNTIPGILKRFLIIDCDTHFLKPTNFITEDGKHILTTGSEYHEEYFVHMQKLHPSLKKYHSSSGISHHCFFHNDKINELIEMVERFHSNEKPFWKISMEIVSELINVKGFAQSEMSEYEIYFNFMVSNYPDEIIIRNLNWENVSSLNVDSVCDYQSVHWHMRPQTPSLPPPDVEVSLLDTTSSELQPTPPTFAITVLPIVYLVLPGVEEAT